MIKNLLLALLFIWAGICFAQTPLTLSRVIEKEDMNAEQLYALTKTWSSKNIVACTLNTNEEKGLSGKGEMAFHTSLMYCSIQGSIEYLLDFQFKNGRLKLTMTDFTHKAEHYAAFNNNMGILYSELPKSLSEIGMNTPNRKSLYKYFFKKGTELCRKQFNEMCTSLETYLNKREEINDNW